MNSSGYATNNITDIKYHYLNNVNILPKVRMLRKGNDVCYLDFYFDGNGQRGTESRIVAIAATSGSFSLLVDKNPQPITEIPSGYYVQEFSTT